MKKAYIITGIPHNGYCGVRIAESPEEASQIWGKEFHIPALSLHAQELPIANSDLAYMGLLGCCKDRCNQKLCSPDACENCPIQATLELLAQKQ